MLKFLTHKLKTHSLNEEHPHQKVEEDDHDSGTESDDEHADIDDPETSMESEGSAMSVVQGMGGMGFGGVSVSPYLLDSALASDNDLNYDDHHSSEEELENINSSNLPAHAPNARDARSRSTSTLPEKRKWSQVTPEAVTCSSSSSSEEPPPAQRRAPNVQLSVSPAALCGHATAHGKGKPYSLAPTRAHSCSEQGGSSDEEVQGLLATTPVQFRTSPPRGTHRPHRTLAPHPSPSPLLPLQQHDSSSPRKRHRQAPANARHPHAIQRPCLDFEKMQQLKARAVTGWRPGGGDHGHGGGGELSVFCW
ncbi:uncharacterized protein LOC111045307 [Nilaparvata lugens]|uniref:uncharacterized protein LOC111045307 n=1 Tax=Nilaparvata lugens TaxID=108931 RepID=UPI000B9893B5|nr:uncharacterized protein LOC111045307 [Nilaparvata lugens]